MLKFDRTLFGIAGLTLGDGGSDLRAIGSGSGGIAGILSFLWMIRCCRDTRLFKLLLLLVLSCGGSCFAALGRRLGVFTAFVILVDGLKLKGFDEKGMLLVLSWLRSSDEADGGVTVFDDDDVAKGPRKADKSKGIKVVR